jgi:hypothetical protein
MEWNSDTKRKIFYWGIFGLFLFYILMWLITLFGLSQSALNRIFSLPSGIAKYATLDYKKFGKVEDEEYNKKI